jgi:hypothetical protein
MSFCYCFGSGTHFLEPILNIILRLWLISIYKYGEFYLLTSYVYDTALENGAVKTKSSLLWRRLEIKDDKPVNNEHRQDCQTILQS